MWQEFGVVVVRLYFSQPIGCPDSQTGPCRSGERVQLTLAEAFFFLWAAIARVDYCCQVKEW